MHEECVPTCGVINIIDICGSHFGYVMCGITVQLPVCDSRIFLCEHFNSCIFKITEFSLDVLQFYISGSIKCYSSQVNTS